jgi:hypothetical protein
MSAPTINRPGLTFKGYVAIYDDAMEQLTRAASREQRAEWLRALAASARDLARHVPAGEADPGTETDPLAWADLRSLLARLADAEEKKASVNVGETGEPVDYDEFSLWIDVAAACTRGEYQDAVREVLALRDEGLPDGTPRYREHAVAEFETVTDLLAAAYPEYVEDFAGRIDASGRLR